MAILNECHYLLTNSIYTGGKILDLKITRSDTFFKKLSSASIRNWWVPYFKWTDDKKILNEQK